MATNRFFFNDGSSTSEESSDDEQVQVQTAKKTTGKSGAKSYASIHLKFAKNHLRIFCFSAPKPYLAVSDDEEDVKRVVRSEKAKRYIC